ncbi:MAG: phosphatidylglycerol lysyltransferase [Treponema sp.]|nr:phosphatidylglycerol lysyltransferase [Treponema sp.]
MNFSVDDPLLNDALLDKALGELILSASGWRLIFAADGDEASAAADIAPVHGIILAAAAAVFADFLKKKLPPGTVPVVVAGMDTRPTGPAMADVLIRSLLASGVAVRFAALVAAPEIMAAARSGKFDGFLYISASHNPIGHNGLKFGLNDGGALPGTEALPLIESFRRLMGERDRIVRMTGLINSADPQTLDEVYAASGQAKKEAYAAYLDFTREIAAGTGPGNGGPLGEGILERISRSVVERPLAAAVDFNGSARTVSIDRELLAGLGVTLRAMNDQPGQIVHRIVPEGESLEPCRLFLERLHAACPPAILGYVPDCDGDRGNLVIWDEGEKKARSLEAQEVFALACVSELAHLVWTGELRYDNQGNVLDKAAVAVNDPTSMRIDRIAEAFGVPVFRAEVGEANVVGLARKLREQGYTVRILGEGAAGGNITHPSAVRDPINTMLSLIKLLAIRSEGNRKGFFELWLARSGQTEAYRPDFALADIIASLPAFVSTGTYSPEALLKVKTADHGLLKSRYQRIFLREWEALKESLMDRYGIAGWEAAAYNGMEEKRGITDFSAAGRGGLKISFFNNAGRRTACVWMRGSGTEPVFRVMADVEGPDRQAEREFIEWQRRMVSEADMQNAPHFAVSNDCCPEAEVSGQRS